MEGIVICVMMAILLRRKVKINCSRVLKVKLQPGSRSRFQCTARYNLISSYSKALQKDICNSEFFHLFLM